MLWSCTPHLRPCTPYPSPSSLSSDSIVTSASSFFDFLISGGQSFARCPVFWHTKHFRVSALPGVFFPNCTAFSSARYLRSQRRRTRSRHLLSSALAHARSMLADTPHPTWPAKESISSHHLLACSACPHHASIDQASSRTIGPPCRPPEL